MVGVEVDEARAEVRRAVARGPRPAQAQGRNRAPEHAPAPAERPSGPPLPDLRDPRFSLERETLKLVLHAPAAIGRFARDLDATTSPTRRTARSGRSSPRPAAPRPASDDPGWAPRLRDNAMDPAVSSALSALAVEPLLSSKEPDTAYVHAHVFRLQELTALRRITDLKSKLQRTNPVEHATEYNRMFGELVALEQHRRKMHDLAMGSA